MLVPVVVSETRNPVLKPSVVLHTRSHNIQEADAGGLRVPGQHELHEILYTKKKQVTFQWGTLGNKKEYCSKMQKVTCLAGGSKQNKMM